MKKAFRIILPILLVLAILFCMVWYLFEYDQEFTRDVLLSAARRNERKGNQSVAAWLYNLAYDQTADNDAVAIELAQQYINSGNYTKAEFILSKAIADGGGTELYVALSKTFVEQDKLLDAVNLLSGVTVPQIKAELDQLRPAAPVANPTPGFYNQYIPVTVSAETGKLYVTVDGTYPSLSEDLYADAITLGDGENTIYALAVGDDGLVSPLSIFGYTIGGVVEPVKFADKEMEKAIRQTLEVSDTAVLMTNDLWDIRSFQVPEGAEDLSDLKHMIYIEELTISSGPADQLSVLSGLTQLKTLSITKTSVSTEELAVIGNLPALQELKLSGCGLSVIDNLSGLVALTDLDLSDNTVRNLTALSGMTELEELHLQHNAIEDLSSLSSLTKLQVLDISHNSVSSLSPLAGLTKLTVLNAATNKLTSLEGVAGLTDLLMLNVGYNALAKIDSLEGCLKLQELDISNNKLTDISVLSKHMDLAKLDFSYNQVSSLPAFDKSCDLVAITGAHNSLTSLDRLSGLKNLNDVYMDYNEELSSIESLKECPVLIQVNVYGTKVTEVKMLTDLSVIVNYNPVQEED